MHRSIFCFIFIITMEITQEKMLIAKCTELYGSGTMLVVARGLPGLRLIVCVNLYNSLFSHP